MRFGIFPLRLLMSSFFSSLAPLAAMAACPSLPYTLTNGQTADATQVMANFNTLKDCVDVGPGGDNNSIQFNAGSGVLGGVGPLQDGQLVIGTTSGAPQAAGLTAGPGIVINNGPGSITVSAVNAATAFQREFGPFAPPNASTFTFIDTPGSIIPTVINAQNIGLVYSAPIVSNTSAWPGAYRAAPTSSTWTLTLRAKYSALAGSNPEFGILIKDTSGKILSALVQMRAGVSYLIAKRLNSNISSLTNPYEQIIVSPPDWFRVNYDGVNINFYVSWDGQNWLYFWSETKTTFLNGTLQLVGIGGRPGIQETTTWKNGSTFGGVVTYWDIDDDRASERIVQ